VAPLIFLFTLSDIRQFLFFFFAHFLLRPRKIQLKDMRLKRRRSARAMKPKRYSELVVFHDGNMACVFYAARLDKFSSGSSSFVPLVFPGLGLTPLKIKY
jgi:hypothetical protein